jgi:hypothetical protein
MNYEIKLKLNAFIQRKLYFIRKRRFPEYGKAFFSSTISSDRINNLIEFSDSEIVYLEIGIENARTFVNVKADQKVGVDPFPLMSKNGLPTNAKISILESDRFFESNKMEFNFAFIDGLHTWEQTYKDIINTFNHGAKKSVLLIDDVVPCDEFAALRSQIECQVKKKKNAINNNYWMGDVYHVVKVLAKFHPELSFYTISNLDEHIQGLIFRKNFVGEIQLQDLEMLSREISHDDFKSVFAKGIPEYFNPVTFNQACELVHAHLEEVD